VVKMKFSIVIPVRNGAATIKSTITSCLNQTFDDYEIIVQDNASTDLTIEIVKSFNSKRIRLFSNDEAVYITDNWNQALSHASGDYVIFLGGDDAIRSDSLRKLALILEKTSADSVTWSQACYTWPDFGIVMDANRLSIPPISENYTFVHIAEHDDELRFGKIPTFPSIYYGCVSRELIKHATKNGPLFDGRCPDLYSAILLSFFTDKYIRIEDVLTVTGLSARSSVTAQISGVSKSENIRTELSQLLGMSGVSRSKNIPEIDLVCTWVLESLELVAINLKIDISRFNLTASRISELIKEEISEQGGISTAQSKVLFEWLSSNEIPLDYETVKTNNLDARMFNFFPKGPREQLIGRFFLVDALSLGVNDSNGAALLIDKMEELNPLFIMSHNQLVSRTHDYESLLNELKKNQFLKIRKPKIWRTPG
jgi:glycosyltransferase involved in cell wall biosynthesis